jgi:hypothetical protein
MAAPLVYLAIGMLGTLWATDSSPSSLLKSKPEGISPEVAANAQAVLDQQKVLDSTWQAYQEAVSQLKQSQERLEEIQQQKDAVEKSVYDSARKNVEMACISLLAIPIEKQMPETTLALRLLEKANSQMSALLGSLPEKQRQVLASIIKNALSESEADRLKAEKQLVELDKKYQDNLILLAGTKARLESQKELLNERNRLVDIKAEEATLAKDELAQKTQEYTKTVMEQAKRAANDKWFWRYWFIGLILLLVITGRIIPALSEYWPILKFLNKFNAFVFHLLTGRKIE